jgi:phosphate transport system protein
MFGLVVDGIEAVTTAFLAGDLEVARRVVADDRLVDNLHHEIELRVEQALTSGEPVSPDEARFMIAVLHIVPELERCGDLVEHIALRTPQRLAAQLTPRCRALVASMGEVAAELFQVATEAFAKNDTTAAARMRLRDDVLDDLHVSLATSLAGSDISVPIAIEMGLVARFYERLGDHAVNVARRVPDSAPTPQVAGVG